MQSELGLIQTFLHAMLEQQVPTAVIGPLVIRADKAPEASLGSWQMTDTSMAADVVEGIYLTIVTTHDDDRIAFHVIQEVVAGLGIWQE